MDIAIKVEKFKKRFGSKLVHKSVTFDVHKKECLGLIGGSGVGKSVILRSLIGLEKPDSGKIYIGDHEISCWKENQLVNIRKKVAYVFQNGALFDSMSVYDNLAYPLREHTNFPESVISEKISELLFDFGLHGNESVYPAELSGGMQKRVGLARSIILDPDIVLYDEPTAGLDPYNTLMIQDLIKKLKKRGVTSVFVTHDMPSAFSVCDRIALLSGGEVKAIGTIKELEKDPDGLLQQFIKGKSN